MNRSGGNAERRRWLLAKREDLRREVWLQIQGATVWGLEESTQRAAPPQFEG